MDKKGNIHEHSKFKLELYRLYLVMYLTILLKSARFHEVFVHDVFAGSGKSANDENGSALIAATAIQKIQKTLPKPPVILRLNERDPNKFTLLMEALRPFQFAQLSDLDANQYIEKWVQPNNSHSLFFIDPYGYTQLSIESLRRLLSMSRCEFLIFIPISHIYRFLRKEETSDQMTPIANFLRDLEIGEAQAKQTNSLAEFSQLVLDALRHISGAEFLFKEMIKNKQNNSEHCLIFITRNILGAEKFLEAQNKLKEEVKSNQAQFEFGFLDNYDAKSILEFAGPDTLHDNLSLYKTGIQAGFLPKQIIRDLKSLEKDGKVTVTPVAGKERKNRGYYVNYEKYIKMDQIVYFLFKG